MIDCPNCKTKFNPEFPVCPSCKRFETPRDVHKVALKRRVRFDLEYGADPIDMAQGLMEQGFSMVEVRELMGEAMAETARTNRRFGYRNLFLGGMALLGGLVLLVPALLGATPLLKWAILLLGIGSVTTYVGLYTSITGKESNLRSFEDAF